MKTKMNKTTAMTKYVAWSSGLRNYIIGELAAWKSYKMVYEDITDDNFTERTGIPKLDSTKQPFALFRKRCMKIPIDTLAVAHNLWRENFSGIQWAEQKARILTLAEIATKILNRIDTALLTGDSAAITLLTELRKYLDQIRKEREPELSLTTNNTVARRVLLTNTRAVDIDAGMLSELILSFRNEVGGLHTIDWSTLTLTELQQLRETLESIIVKKTETLSQIEYENES